jgi:hypothetical protein
MSWKDGAIKAICCNMAIVFPQCPCSVFGTPKSIVGIDASEKRQVAMMLADVNLHVVPILNQVAYHKQLLFSWPHHKIMGSETKVEPYDFAATFPLTLLMKLNIS